MNARGAWQVGQTRGKTSRPTLRVGARGPGGWPTGRVGGKYTVVAVTVDAGRGKDLGQAVQELQGREAQRGPTGGIGPWQRSSNGSS
jgi:hypothetical protein